MFCCVSLRRLSNTQQGTEDRAIQTAISCLQRFLQTTPRVVEGSTDLYFILSATHKSLWKLFEQLEEIYKDGGLNSKDTVREFECKFIASI